MQHRSRGKGRIILYPARTHIHIGYAETRAFKAIHQDHGRVVRYRTIAISHRTILRHTYVRTKSNGEKERRYCTLAILAEHTSLDSRFESNEGYILFAVSHLPMSYAGPFMSTLWRYYVLRTFIGYYR